MCASCQIGFYKEDNGACHTCGTSQIVTVYVILIGLIAIPFFAIGLSVDGSKHDSRFGLTPIIVTWMQYTGESYMSVVIICSVIP